MASQEDQFGSLIFPRGPAPGQKAEPPRRPPPKTMPLADRAPEPRRLAALPTLPVPEAVPPAPEPAPAEKEQPARQPDEPSQLPPPVGPSGFALVPAPRVADVVEAVPLGPAALQLVAKDQTPRQFFDALVEAELYADAIRFLAYVLPRREAIWWGQQCLRRLDPKAPPAVVESIARWVREPTEDNRRSAQAAAQAAGPASPSGLVAQAVFWSGGSIAPPDAAPAPPGPHLTPQAVAMAITNLILADAAHIPDRAMQVLTHGVEVGNGTFRWQDGSSS